MTSTRLSICVVVVRLFSLGIALFQDCHSFVANITHVGCYGMPWHKKTCTPMHINGHSHAHDGVCCILQQSSLLQSEVCMQSLGLTKHTQVITSNSCKPLPDCPRGLLQALLIKSRSSVMFFFSFLQKIFYKKSQSICCCICQNCLTCCAGTYPS